MAPPTLDPQLRDTAEVEPTNSYAPSTRIWVWRHGAWHAGVVVAVSAHAATVTYRPRGGTSTAVDTVTARYLTARVHPDLLLDHDSRTDMDQIYGMRAGHTPVPAQPLPHRVRDL